MIFFSYPRYFSKKFLEILLRKAFNLIKIRVRRVSWIGSPTHILHSGVSFQACKTLLRRAPYTSKFSLFFFYMFKMFFPFFYKYFLKLFCVEISRRFIPRFFRFEANEEESKRVHSRSFLASPPKGYFPAHNGNRSHQDKNPKGFNDISQGEDFCFKKDKAKNVSRNKSHPKQSQKRVKDSLSKRRFLPSYFRFLRHVNLPNFYISLGVFCVDSKPKKRVCHAF